ncbi:hypothetical protein THAOC_19727, partial [Thalassiosira oceanica]
AFSFDVDPAHANSARNSVHHPSRPSPSPRPNPPSSAKCPSHLCECEKLIFDEASTTGFRVAPPKYNFGDVDDPEWRACRGGVEPGPPCGPQDSPARLRLRCGDEEIRQASPSNVGRSGKLSQRSAGESSNDSYDSSAQGSRSSAGESPSDSASSVSSDLGVQLFDGDEDEHSVSGNETALETALEAARGDTNVAAPSNPSNGNADGALGPAIVFDTLNTGRQNVDQFAHGIRRHPHLGVESIFAVGRNPSLDAPIALLDCGTWCTLRATSVPRETGSPASLPTLPGQLPYRPANRRSRAP